MPGRKRSLRSRLPLIGGLLFMTLFTAAVIWGVVHFIQDSGKPERPKIQTISLVRPPPPKPPEEKPPEPQKIDKPKEEVKLDQPQPPQPEAPPPPPGGIPDGPAGGMATDLAAGSGIGIGGGGANDERRSWYSNMISRQLEDDLRRAKRLQGKDYRVVAQIWFSPSGAVSRVQIDKGTGDSELDEALRQEILQVSLRDPLPADIPQPVRLRVVSR
ncbi:energy transducer TonB [Thiobacillus sp.]|jgi:protein TonB|uniref:energy transducer TonB family protein n=1 Tax=Thiobacillus sp. TaxID=924 RepID=UPI0025E7886C|nr:energy transducer TonB [Thiobacillus sp.]